MQSKHPFWQHDKERGHGVYVSNELSKYRKIINSQCGEEGIIDEIFRRIKSGNKQCVEFLARDGAYLSNTKYLVDSGWTGVMIESDPALFKELKKNIGNIAICIKANTINLETILKNTPVKKNFDLVSMDVDDGSEYYIWEKMVTYSPKVVLVQFKPQNGSLEKLIELSKVKGYVFVATTCWNAFFVKKDYLKYFREI